MDVGIAKLADAQRVGEGAIAKLIEQKGMLREMYDELYLENTNLLET